QKHPFVKSDFQVYRMNIPVPEVDEDLEADQNVKTYKMKNVSRLAQDIDSLKKDNKQVVHAFSKNISNRMGAFVPLIPVRPEDSLRPKPAKEINLLQASQEKPSQKEEKAQKVRDTLTDVLYLYSEGQQLQLLTSAKNSVSNILTTVRGKKEELQNRYKLYNLHILSMHKKYALGLSCIILFFVGAPLGAIIRKGGLGLPMVVAIILFLTYYFLGVFAGNYAKEGNIHPILGAWLSTIVMLPLGMALTRRATTDRSFSAFSGISQFFGSLFKRKKKKTVR
ncbi:MAG: LptF/LptG family permease, partial [Flavobacteriaceae bacterium]